MESKERSVLIVEDDEGGRKLLRKYLRKFTLYEAVDGVEGWDLFLKLKPDVVVTDIRMPNLDGMSLLKLIRDTSPDTPVIILSGVGTLKDVVESLRLGAHDYLEKPLHKKEIVTHTVEKAFAMLRLVETATNYQRNLEQAVAEKTAKLREELEARSNAEKELLQAQKEWKRTFDAIPDLIAIIDKNFEIVRSNKAMAEAMELGKEKTASCLCYSKVHRTKNILPTCPHVKLLRDGKKHTVEIFEECLGGHYEITAVPYYGEDGTTLLGSVHIARNINERKMMELERDRMQVKFLHAQKLESVGQLASGIAHEINTPIQFVSSNNDFLEESFLELKELVDGYEALFQSIKKGELNTALVEKAESLREEVDWAYLAEEIPTALKQTKEGLQRVATIVRAMKEFSHPGSKEKELRNLNDIAKTTGIVARNEWKYVAELKMNLAENLSNVMCFSDDIGQVFLNILINAAHAIEDKLGRNPEGQKGIITIASKDGDGHVEVSISDTGIGMAKEMHRKVFDPFYTTKKVGRGTGQGLAIAWNIIVEKHGGELKVESEAGAGTTFSIRLPKR